MKVKPMDDRVLVSFVEEETTTIVVQPGWTAKLDPSGSYVITRKEL